MEKIVTTTIDATMCIGCGRCVSVCPSDTITIQDQKAVVSGTESLNCGHCAAVCPTGAVCVAGLDPALSTFRTFQTREDWLPHGEGNIQDLVKIMQSRRSCRNFHTDKPVPRDLLEDLVRIGVTAPSGTNSQMWTFTLVPDRDRVRRLGNMVAGFYRSLNRTAQKAWLRTVLKCIGKPELALYYRQYYASVEEAMDKWEREEIDLLFHDAPAAIVVGSDLQASCPAEDALLATQNILLGAHVLGLGTCLVGFAVEAMKRKPGIRQRIGVGRNERVYAVIALGYPDEAYERVAGRRRAVIRYWA